MESQLQRTCMVHYQKIICICTHKNCKNRLICVYCIKYHEGAHNKSIIPYEEIFCSTQSETDETLGASNISFFKKFRDFYSKKCENILTSSSKLPEKVLDKLNDTLCEVKNNFLENFSEYQSKVNELVEKFNLKHEDIEKSFVNAMDKMADFENQSQVNSVNYSTNSEVDINKICDIYLKIKSGILSNLDKELEMQENLLMNYSLNFDNSLQVEKNSLNRCLKENLDSSLKNITNIFAKLNIKTCVSGTHKSIITKPIKAFSEPIKIVSLINNWLSAKFITDPAARPEDKNKLYFFEGYHSSSLDMYENLEEFVKGNVSRSYRNVIPEFGSNHAVVYNEMFYFVEYDSGQTNNIIKYDLEKKQVLVKKTLKQALTGKYSQVGGCNDIILHSNQNGIYAFYTTEENKHRIVISLLDEDSLEIKETWNTESKPKKEIGNPMIVGNKVYCYEKYNEKPTRLCFMYDLETKVTDNYFSVHFPNEGGQDYSLTYHDNLDCFLTVSNKIVYKYEITFEDN